MSSEEKICPVVRVIRDIRGGGIYVDDSEESAERVIKLGGSENTTEFIFDDMSFYIMSRKMELARFELSKPTLVACENKYKSMFRDMVDIDYTSLYTRIIDRAFKKKYIYQQFVQLIDLLSELEELILARVDNMGRTNQPINISLPDMFLLPHVDQLIIYRPDILANTMNQIINYINRININALLKEPLRDTVSPVEPFSSTPPNMNTRIEKISANSVESYLTGMKNILAQELEVALYIREIEGYQCKVINHVNKVYDICKKMTAGLTA